MATKSRTKRPAKSAASKPRRDAPAAVKASPPPVPAVPPVVGIGASAGGLEAFTQLLGALPTDTGMAFVLVQHLEPKHESVLTALLSRATKMPVSEITEGMRVEPNHVYVIPANADLTLPDSTLHIVGRKAAAGRHTPIDTFFKSLAETQGPRGIGVILSGTATDGTAGIKAIKQEGGVTFAQDPESAKFDGMPRSAIATGCVDFVLDPERIAKELARIVKHPFVGLLPLHAIPALPAHEDEWARLFRFLRTNTGVDFRLYKRSTIKRRLARRMAVNKLETLPAYQKILEKNRTEVDALFEELLILVTEFFRDADVFEALRDRIFPQVLAEKPADEPVRIWSAGCSTGQEAYSLAMALLESLGERAHGRSIQIFGTDVSDKAIEKARVGMYTEDELKGVSQERLRRFFRKTDGHYQVEDRIREMCVFARHDLIRDPPFSKLDLLACRNVLIYFEPPLQRRVLAAFHYGLKNTGILLLGKTESLGAYPELFAIVDRKFKVFRKNMAAQVPFHVQTAYEHVMSGKPLKPEAPAIIDLEKEADQMVWERSSFAGLVVNDDLQILHFRGDTGPYLRPVPGKATLQLMRLLREEMVLEVRSAIQKVRRTGKTVRAEGIEIRRNQHNQVVNVEVSPLVQTGPERSFLILFEPVSATAATPPPAKSAHRARVVKAPESQEVVRLRAELVRTREYVQSIIRDQETTNEELKTANEEALSSMEELQSTNEELETAKEELQSSNEELVTLNEQLQNRNSELGQLSSDLANVLTGIDIPVVILSSDGRIRRFTPPAEKLLGLIAGDIGRPIGKLRIGVHVPDMEDLLATVVAKGREESREVQTDSGHWFLLRIRPFRTDDRVEGVLLAFVDIDQIRKHQEELQTDKNFIAAILDAAKGLLVVVLDRDGRITRFNRVCQQLTGYSQEEVKGKVVWDILFVPEEAQSAKAEFNTVNGTAAGQTECHWIAKDGRRLLISWAHTVAKDDGVESVIATGIDVTERQAARQWAQQSEATVQAVMDSSAQAIFACGPDSRILLANPVAEKMFGYSRHVLIGLSVETLLPVRFRTLYEEHRDGWFAQPQNRTGLDLAGLRKDGSEFPIEVSISSIDSEEGTRGVAFVSDITERKKSEQARAEYRDQLAWEVAALDRLRDASNRLWRLHDLKAGLEEMIDAGIALLDADFGNIQLLNPQKDVLEIAAQRGFGGNFLEFFKEVSAAEDTACGRSLRGKQRVIIEDVETDADYAPYRAIARAAGYRAVQSTPLAGNKGQTIGIFSTHFRNPHRPTELDLRRFDLYAHQAAEFIERVKAEEQLRRSEAAVQALLETAAQAVLAIDKEGRIMLANATATTMFGYAREELLAGKLERLIPERLRAMHAQHRNKWFADPLNRPMGIGLDLAGIRKDGSEFPIEVSLSHIGADGGILGVAFVSDITERKKNEQTLIEYKDQLQKLSGALISAQEAGNREVARELHDVFSQELAALGMEIASLRDHAKSETDLTAGLADLGKRIAKLADSIHETSRKLHPSILDDLGLRVTLEHECESFEQRWEIPTRFIATDVADKLPGELSLCLYRVAQECLRNIQKHAPESDTVQVSLTGRPEGVTLRVADTGDGFDLNHAMRQGGLGLISMEERVRIVNGTLTVESEPGQGTIVTAFVPLEKKTA